METVEKNTNINNETSASEASAVTGNSASVTEEAMLKTRLKEAESRLRELEAYKNGVELKELRQGLYQKYMFTEEDQKITDTLIDNHKVKNHQAFIED